jgi:hypothetical protein
VRDDGGIASCEHQPGALDAFLNGFCAPGGVLLDSATDDLGALLP